MHPDALIDESWPEAAEPIFKAEAGAFALEDYGNCILLKSPSAQFDFQNWDEVAQVKELLGRVLPPTFIAETE